MASNTPAKPAPSPEQALSELLSFDQLTELAVLIAKITDVMHRQITSSFEESTPYPPHPRERLQKGAQNPNLNPRNQLNRQDSNDGDQKYRVKTKREQEVSEPELNALKNDALEYFQNWRDGIVSRIVDASNSKAGEGGSLQEMREPVVDDDPPPEYTVLGAHVNIQPSDTALKTLYKPQQTSLAALSRKERIAILSTTLLLLLSQGHYTAHSRILLLYLVSSLHLPLHVLIQAEIKLAQGLLEAAKRMSADEETKKRSQENQASRRWKVGLAGVAGAALIGVTGGLAAPLVAGAIGSVMGGLGLGATAAAGLLGTLSSSGVIVGSLFGAYGYGMTSKMMDQYAKEVEDFAFLPMKRLKTNSRGVVDVPPEDRRLRVTIGISGWLSQKRDVMRPWRVLGQQSEVFALKWELEALLDMGKSLETMVSSAVWTVASREIISRTVFASLMLAMWPLGLMKLSKIVDNPFNVAKSRADKAGLVLADAIINKAQGERPVTLVGYSVGARVIYSCLMNLAERRAFGLVESAVLIGAPTPSDASDWRAMRSVVASRLVNVYVENDYILAFLYRTSSIQLGVAGLEEVQGVAGVENVDVSKMVSGHLRYPHLIGRILETIGWEDINMQEVEREDAIAKAMDHEDEELKKQEIERQTSEERKQGIGTRERERERERPKSFEMEKQFLTLPMRPAAGGQQKQEESMPATGRGDQHVIPMLRERPVIKDDTEDLISFDEPKAKDRESPRDIEQVRPREKPAEPMHSTPLHRVERPHEMTSQPHDQDRYESDDEDGGIVMEDNDDSGITMLEPTPMPDEEEPPPKATSSVPPNSSTKIGPQRDRIKRQQGSSTSDMGPL